MASDLGDTCRRCNALRTDSVFCQVCRLYLPDETGTVEHVTYTRRFFGDYVLESLLFLLTFIVGWLIWFAFTASDAQSPAKKLLNAYVIDMATGRAVTGGRLWVRDPLLKLLVIGFIVPFGNLIDGLFVLFDKDRQSLHDKAVGTAVVYAPGGLPEAMRSTGGRAVGAAA